MRLYGDAPIGPWGEHVRLIAPQAEDKQNRFPAAALAEAARLRRQRDSQEPNSTPIPDLRGWRFLPEEGGLLPWGTEASDLMFFEVDPGSDPERWTTDTATFLVRLLDAG